MERLETFMIGRDASEIETVVFSLQHIIHSMHNRSREAYLKVDMHEGRMVQRVAKLCEDTLAKVGSVVDAANALESIFLSVAKTASPKNGDECLAVGFDFADRLETIIAKVPSMGRFELLANKIANIAAQIQLRFLDPILESDLREQRRAVNKRLDGILLSVGIRQ
jgi:hypothetical protein